MNLRYDWWVIDRERMDLYVESGERTCRIRGLLFGCGSVRDLGRRSGGLSATWACGELYIDLLKMLYVLAAHASRFMSVLHISSCATISKASGVGGKR